MIQTLLVANRGEIARRIFRTCRELGIFTVAVYSDADAGLPHVREADLALRLGPGPVLESYLNSERLLSLALGNGVDAIHPGYGFLAENASFAEACAQRGMGFIGPPAEVIRLMGDKASARTLAVQAEVPVIPGGERPVETLPEAESLALEIGFPVLVKAVAGGGGRGIRVVHSREDLGGAMEAARREAANSFGDGRLLLEKALLGARHVEVQVLADQHGTVLHLLERDCSIQRRHQKLVEECPAPALEGALREALHSAAVRLAQSTGYVGAGTVEFLVHEGNYYFLEMNTRLQVEHPVTEMVLGLDLVRLQIEVAEGRKLHLRQEALNPNGHALECRLTAENPNRNFFPVTGTLEWFEFPQGSGIRVDSGFESGNEIGPYYDSLLAKLCVWGATRAEALRKMTGLLQKSRVAGMITNVVFLQGVIGHPVFSAAGHDTEFVNRHGKEILEDSLPNFLLWEMVLAAAAIQAWNDCNRTPEIFRAAVGENPDRGHSNDVVGLRRLCCRVEQDSFDICVSFKRMGKQLALELTCKNLRTNYRYRHDSQGEGRLCLSELQIPIGWSIASDEYWISIRGRHIVAKLSSWNSEESSESPEAAFGQLNAPLPGRILAVAVKPGQQVAAGDLLLILEAMKVEHRITAAGKGRIESITAQVGGLVARGDPLISWSDPGAHP